MCFLNHVSRSHSFPVLLHLTSNPVPLPLPHRTKFKRKNEQNKMRGKKGKELKILSWKLQ